MIERPALFNTEMVRAIDDGRKTETRRPVKARYPYSMEPKTESPETLWPYYEPYVYAVPEPVEVPCPYGEPGDRLWVRETFQIENTYEYYPERGDEPLGPVRLVESESGDYELIPRYRASEPDTMIMVKDGEPPDCMAWRPSIHMPRWASRILLEVTYVRVERIQEITAEGVAREGIDCTDLSPIEAVWKFQKLWDSINAKRGFGWDTNPRVWVGGFRRVLDVAP